MKKAIIIISSILGIILIGLIYYYFFFAQTSTPGGTTSTNPVTNFFPFGQGSNTPRTSSTTPSTRDDGALVQTGDYLAKLRLISNEPVAGSTFVENKTGVSIQYIEKATGHIYNVSTYSPDVTQLSNTTIPRIHEAFFTTGGSGVLARYVGDDGESVQTLYGKVPALSTTTVATATSTTLTVTQLPTNIAFVTVSPSGKTIFSLQRSASGSTGVLSTPTGTSKKQIWDSSLRSVLPQFIGENSILMTTAPNAQVTGYAYTVDTKTGSIKNILGPVADLTTLPNPAGGDMVFYTSANNSALYHYVLANASTTQITPTTYPEKCVFDTKNKNILYCAVPTTSLSSGSLDNWYLGTETYSDNIWKYDLKNNTSTMVEDLALNAGRDIDAINLHINSVGSLLLFENKADGSLWSLNVGQ